jgi:hypothetical protein
VRNYDWSTRAFYTEAVASASSTPALLFTPRSRASFLPTPPSTVSAPYLDLFGRGYLMTLTAPVVSSAGALLGVAGADVRIVDLMEVDDTPPPSPHIAAPPQPRPVFRTSPPRPPHPHPIVATARLHPTAETS